MNKETNIPYDDGEDSKVTTIGSSISQVYTDYKARRKVNVRGKPKKKKRIKSKKLYADCDHYLNKILEYSNFSALNQSSQQEWDNIPEWMQLDSRGDPGFVFGLKSKCDLNKYVGMPQGEEGNIVVIGSNGSGKSAGIAKPTLISWQGTMCITDIKGELSDFYAELFEMGIVNRPFKVFDPIQTDGIGYDPFYWLSKDGKDHLMSNIREITIAIIPTPLEMKDPFWVETEQAILQAALLYYFQYGLSFSQTVTKMLSMGVSELIEELITSKDTSIRIILGELCNMKPEVLANFDRGLRNKLMLFATDPYISHAFRGTREGATCFTWDDLDKYNIFLSIPIDKIDQWGSVINLMYTQLIRHLERRPEKYSPEGANNVQTLLLMDEFARFGKLNMLTEAISTLRSKCVNFCLIVQSIAQIDKFYGECDRRIIFDNCQYKAILRAGDTNTQKYLSELIGTTKCTQRSQSESLNEYGECVGYSKQISEIYEPFIFPHEFLTLEDIPLITPKGFYRVEKLQLHNGVPKEILSSTQKMLSIIDDFVMPELEQELLSEKYDFGPLL
ncbi:type IV secretory system conjugative DNA transfer family protein [Kineothrix sp. MB12-C1]|uniref:type IV secretory system conjugative DNA transfer family protein n=1 Tax=Kineothrix sp. MB12-C1 TaxID=3070215 RepID=UPI0027D2750F|nr:type IV secretory system conjugative DNA transfer family protein [Kineothrix sp. MB12-C1]WMC91319.1 type IV secretory system conjugative DNA transfer family protein [Kineothrix sp. MB12-C1]